MNIWKACLRRRNNVQYEANVTAQHLSFEKRYFIKYGRIDVICGLKKVFLQKRFGSETKNQSSASLRLCLNFL